MQFLNEIAFDDANDSQLFAYLRIKENALVATPIGSLLKARRILAYRIRLRERSLHRRNCGVAPERD
jgi:hypothetical protein